MSGGTTGAPVTPGAVVVEPIGLEEAAQNLRAVDDGNSPPTYVEADLITRLITTSRELCEEELEMSLVQKTLETTLQSFCPARIELPNGPVRSIVSVTYVDTDGVDIVLAADQYRLSTSGRMAVLWPAYNVSWPSVRNIADSIRVRYTAGYPSTDSPAEEVPTPIVQAMHLFIAHYYTNRESVDANTLMELPLGSRYLLGKYRRGLGV